METSQICPPRVREAILGARMALERAGASRVEELGFAAEAAEIMGGLTESTELAHALLARPVLASAGLTSEQAAGIVGRGATDIAVALQRLGTLGLPRDWSPAQGLDTRQTETLRKMLLAVVSDPRLVLARLAEELVALRHARALPENERRRRALEARAVYAPLANRLGVWQLKWELEDLAFRYLEPEEYRRVAAALNERRADREHYIEMLCEDLQRHLRAAGIAAEVYGRPKHIYSIYRKMQRKQLAFEQLFDVRAVRIVVASIPECYAALGVVHGHWPYIPGEFDDYIATPKGNGYRSIHTAVIGPAAKSLEVQIRTPQMHEHAELGVAAHWSYKEGGPRDADYQRKIEWVRRLLEPQDGAGPTEADRDLIEGMRAELFEDRVYVLTPKGEVIDLPRGATPLDFAYQVHTSLGHRCRGAKANGRIVPLSHVLSNGEIIEIITGKHEAPSRDWLAPEQGYLASPRSRSKVRAWFRRQDVGANRNAGAVLAERELARIGARPEQLAALARELQARDVDHLHQLLGEGEITVTQLMHAANRLFEPAPPARSARAARAVTSRRRSSPVEIEGVGDLPTTLARCCAPLRPQPIAGYVALGRGVTVHRSDCAGFIRMAALKPERVLKVDWSSADAAALAVLLAVSAYDRRGLLRDLTDVLAVERLSIDAVTSRTDHESGMAYFSLAVAVNDLEQLARVLRRLEAVPNVIEARRSH
ncbi:MAG TPA: bifunctional (p)ppGpp synthetase/guanosine-3',5'-bis(diphosphate) 3'-pyrophosphohydrolase [Steroidobacteraceae bacterium]|nr:bifunctional (p)ppGpp synthetase/guanosine-3',5'-bis(diphosphate) 3'-pyrophosphohydrolase [Steroidobacteraceae bacterium]